MKRYMVFAYVVYYPSGGWGDFISAHETIDEARVVALRAVGPDDWDSDNVTGRDVAQIVDSETMEVVQKLTGRDL
jgi:hypothetical protein